jgi:hypothetical protein
MNANGAPAVVYPLLQHRFASLIREALEGFKYTDVYVK